MFGDLIRATSPTGGTGALTLTAVTGWPGWADVFGATGTVAVAYTVAEYTDSTLATLARLESGLGDVALATLVLTRRDPQITWDGTTYVPAAVGGLTFGTTAANVVVGCEPATSLQPGTVPAAVTGVGDGLGLAPFDGWTTGVQALTANVQHYVPFHYVGPAGVGQAGIQVSTAVASTHVKGAVYEVGSDGAPARQLYDLAATPWDTSTTGGKTTTLAMHLPAGWYYLGLLSDGAPTLRAWVRHKGGVGGMTGGGALYWYTASLTYATGLPATRSATLTPSSSPNAPILWLKPS